MLGLRQRLSFFLFAAVIIDVIVGGYFYPKVIPTLKSNYDFPVLAIFITGATICFVHVGLMPGLLAASYGKTQKGLRGIALSCIATIPCTVVGAVVSIVVGYFTGFALTFVCLLLSFLFGAAVNALGISLSLPIEKEARFMFFMTLEIAFVTGSITCLLLARFIQNSVMKNEYMPSVAVVMWGAIAGAVISGLFLQKVWTALPILPIATGLSGLVFMLAWIIVDARKPGVAR